MARSRNIKPGFCQNEHLAQLPFETRLMFALLPCFADRAGRMEDRPLRIKMQMFPADQIDANAMLQQLHDAKFIIRYESENTKYIQIVNFSKHQNPHIKEAESTIPAPCKHRTSPEKADTSHADSLNLVTDSLQEIGADAPRKQPKAKSTSKRKLPADFELTDKLRTYCVEKRPDLKPEAVFEDFCDYYRSHGKTMADWDLTWMRWVRNERSKAQSRTGETPVQRSERLSREELQRAESSLRASGHLP